jgi:hypothetical protein
VPSIGYRYGGVRWDKGFYLHNIFAHLIPPYTFPIRTPEKNAKVNFKKKPASTSETGLQVNFHHYDEHGDAVISFQKGSLPRSFAKPIPAIPDCLMAKDLAG